MPVMGVENWSNGWLPSIYQGTVVRPREPRILNLDPPPFDDVFGHHDLAVAPSPPVVGGVRVQP